MTTIQDGTAVVSSLTQQPVSHSNKPLISVCSFHQLLFLREPRYSWIRDQSFLHLIYNTSVCGLYLFIHPSTFYPSIHLPISLSPIQPPTHSSLVHLPTPPSPFHPTIHSPTNPPTQSMCSAAVSTLDIGSLNRGL